MLYAIAILCLLQAQVACYTTKPGSDRTAPGSGSTTATPSATPASANTTESAVNIEQLKGPLETAQSSVGWDGFSSYAMDGNTGGQYFA